MLSKRQLTQLRKASPAPNRVGSAMRLHRPRVTQEQLEDAIGVAQPTISSIVNGKTPKLPLETARKFARFFGCSIEDLFPARDEVAA